MCEMKEYKKKSQAKEIWKRMKKNKAAMVGLVILSIFVFAAIFADLISDFDTKVVEQDVTIRLLKPSTEHWFGTDAYGRDIFARIVHGTRITFSIAILTTIVSVTAGLLLGASAGFYGGITESIIMRITDTIMCLPPMLFSLSIIAALGPGMRNLIIAVSFTMSPYFIRIIRASVMTVVDAEYIEAARACGTKDSRIILRHILPNAMGPIIVQATMSVSFVIMLAAGLSFIGLGVQPPSPEWGAMLSEGREYMRYSPYIVAIPGIAIVVSSLSLNLLGDGLRDALDPKLKN